MSFSERIGKKAQKEIIQVDSIDDELKNALWNLVYIFWLREIETREWVSGCSLKIKNLCNRFWVRFLKKRVDEKPDYHGKFNTFTKSWFFSADWNEVYDLLEFISKNLDSEAFDETVNGTLEHEISAYRLINHEITPISDKSQTENIEKALQNDVSGVRQHLQSALELLSDKKNPDYRNSIKESISSVESMCKTITGKEKSTLSGALKELEASANFHPTLIKGFKSIYGYTSDSDGIRHGLMEESNLSQEDAIFMLVTCSAFVNYLTIKSSKA